MRKVFLISTFFVVAISSAQAAFGPLANANEEVLFSEDFDNNNNNWGNIGTGAGEATIGTDPGGTGASVWYPSQEGTYTPSVMTYGTAAMISEGSINVYIRARVDDVDGGNYNRFYWKVDEASPSYVADMASFTVRPASISTYTYYNTSGSGTNVNASTLTFPDTSTFVNFLLKMTDNGDDTMTLEAFYYNPNTSSYVAVSPTVINARIITGSFARFTLGSINATGLTDHNRVYIDSVRVTQLIDTTKTRLPVFSPDGGTYDDVTVTMTCPTSGATIRYTTDGTEPTTNSTVYSSPVEIDHALTLKAKAWSALDPSGVRSTDYSLTLTEDSQVIFESTASNQQFTVVNRSDQVITPRVIVRGWTADRETTPLFAEGLTLTNSANSSTTAFSPKMLTGGTWILNSDGSADWGYRSGAWETGYGEELDPRLRVYDQDKLSLDHYPIISLSTPYWNGAYKIVIASASQAQTWTCNVQFPTGTVVENFNIAVSCSDTVNATPVARIYSDSSCQNLLAEATMSNGIFAFDQTPQLPNNFYLRMTATNINTSSNVTLYFMYFGADLDASNLSQITLQPGSNTITLTDSQSSSHQWRIILEDDALQADPDLDINPVIPSAIINYQSRYRTNPADTQELVDVDDIFPLGFYYGLTLNTMDFVVDDMVDLNCNVIHGSGLNIQELDTILDFLEDTPLKLIYEGGSGSTLFYLSAPRYFSTSAEEVAYNQAYFIPAANQYVADFEDRPGLLSWNITEEIAADVPQRLYDNGYYTLLRTLDTSHPVTILHNNYDAAVNDLALNHPSAVSFDKFLFGYDPLSSGTSLPRSIGYILNWTSMHRELCDTYDVPCWFIGQAYAHVPIENSNSWPYDRHGGVATLTAPMHRMQGWLAIAEGVRGLFLYVYRHSTYADGLCGTVRDQVFEKDTVQWNAVQQLFGELKTVTPLLLRTIRTEENDEDVTVPSTCIARTFERRDMTVDGIYVVVVNTSDENNATLTISGSAVTSAEIVWDVKRQQPAQNETLAPGEGTILWLGDEDQVSLDRAILPLAEVSVDTDYSNYSAPATINITADDSDSPVAISKVEFYNNGILLDTDTDSSDGWTCQWTNVAASGTDGIAITAKAYNDCGAYGVMSEPANATVTDSDLKCYWKLDDGEGSSAADSSGTSNTGTVSGASWTDGKILSGLSLDGTDDYIYKTNASNLPAANSDQTVCCWFYVSSNPNDRRCAISMYGYYSAIAIGFVDSSGMKFGVWRYGNNLMVTTDTLPTADQWHHVAYVKSGTSGNFNKLYIDGSLVAESNITTNTAAAGTVCVGCTPIADSYWPGLVDEVRIYNRALSATEISALAAGKQ